MLPSTNSYCCNVSLVPQFTMAKSSGVDRSRSPKPNGEKGEMAELDDKFVDLWATHCEPKLAEHQQQLADKNE